MKKFVKYLSGGLMLVPFVALAQAPPQVALTKTGITTILTSIRDWAAALIFILGILMMLYAAFMYMTAAGDEEKIGKAKSTLIYGLIGVGIAIIAFGVFTLVQSFLA